MSFEATALVSHLNYKDIPELETLGFKQSHKLVLFTMANYADRENMELYPSYATLAKDVCAKGERNVITTVSTLVKLGLITKTKRAGVNGNSSNVYKITIIQFLEKHGYMITPNEKGFLTATKIPSHSPDKSRGANFAPPASPDKSRGANFAPPLMQTLHPPYANFAPDPINDPIKQTKDIYICDFDFKKDKTSLKYKGDLIKAFDEFRTYKFHSDKKRYSIEELSKKWGNWLERSKCVELKPDNTKTNEWLAEQNIYAIID
mgnify:CR=1 FL=1|tara:strand:- start:339 stop:1124 length:786 start_codon:yes stop_codon:yes gene_type:complete